MRVGKRRGLPLPLLGSLSGWSPPALYPPKGPAAPTGSAPPWPDFPSGREGSQRCAALLSPPWEGGPSSSRPREPCGDAPASGGGPDLPSSPAWELWWLSGPGVLLPHCVPQPPGWVLRSLAARSLFPYYPETAGRIPGRLWPRRRSRVLLSQPDPLPLGLLVVDAAVAMAAAPPGPSHGWLQRRFAIPWPLRPTWPASSSSLSLLALSHLPVLAGTLGRWLTCP